MFVRLGGDASEFEAAAEKAVNIAIKSAQKIRDAGKQASLTSNWDKEAEKIIERNLTPTEKYQKAVERLNQTFLNTELTAEQVNRELDRLTAIYEKQQAELDGTAEAQRRLNKEIKEAEQLRRREARAAQRQAEANARREQAAVDREVAAIIKRNLTPLEKYNLAVERLDELMVAGKLSTIAYLREYMRLGAQRDRELDKVNGVAEAQRRLNKEMRDAERVKRRNAAYEEKRIQQAERMQQALEKEAQAITKRNQTPAERHDEALKNLNRVYGSTKMSAETLSREIARLDAQFVKAQSELDGTAEAQRKLNALMKEGESLTKANQTASKTYRDTKKRLKELLDAEAISQRTYNAELAKSRELFRTTRNPELNRLIKEGAELTEKHTSAVVKHRRAQARLDEQYRRGIINLRTYKAETKDLNRQFGVFGAGAQKLATDLVFVGLNMTALFGGMSVAVVGFTANLAKLAIEQEKLSMSFRTLVGDVERAKTVLADLQDFAISTPFNLEEIARAGRTMLAFGEEGDYLIGTLKMLGDAAAASGEDLEMISLVFNQIRGVGHLVTQDFRQLSTRGILSLQDFVDQGIAPTVLAAQEMLSEGRISFEMVRQVLQGLTEEGGRFAGGIENMANTVSGQLAKVRGDIRNLGIEIGSHLLPAIKEVLEYVGGWVDRFNRLSDTTKQTIAYVFVIASAVLMLGTAISTVILVGGQLMHTLNVLLGLKSFIIPLIGTLIGRWMQYTAATIGATTATTALAAVLGKIIVIIGLAYAAYRGVLMYYEADISDFEARADDAINRLREARKTGSQRRSLQADRIEEIVDVAQRRKAIQEAIKLNEQFIEKERANQKRIGDIARKTEATVGDMLTGGRMSAKFWEQHAEISGIIEDRINLGSRLKQMYKEATPEQVIQDLLDSYTKLKEGLEEEIKFHGLSELEVELRKLNETAMQNQLTQEELNRLQQKANELRQLDQLLKEKDLRTELKDETDKLIEGLEKEVEILRLETIHGEMAAAVWREMDLAKRGVSDATLQHIAVLEKEKVALEKAKKELAEDEAAAKRMLDSLKTPLDEFNEQVAKIRDLFSKGLFGDPNHPATRETMQKLIDMAQEELDKSNLTVEISTVGFTNNAIRRGSAEFARAMSAVYYGSYTNPGAMPPMPPGGGGRGRPPQPPVPPQQPPPVNPNDKTHKVLKNIAQGINRVVTVLESIESQSVILGPANVGGN